MKKWYQSRIILVSIALFTTALTVLTGGQRVVEYFYPSVSPVINALIQKDVSAALAALGALVIAILRFDTSTAVRSPKLSGFPMVVLMSIASTAVFVSSCSNLASILYGERLRKESTVSKFTRPDLVKTESIVFEGVVADNKAHFGAYEYSKGRGQHLMAARSCPVDVILAHEDGSALTDADSVLLVVSQGSALVNTVVKPSIFSSAQRSMTMRSLQLRIDPAKPFHLYVDPLTLGVRYRLFITGANYSYLGAPKISL